MISGLPASARRPLGGALLRALRSEVAKRDKDVIFRSVTVAYALFSLLDWMTTSTALELGGRERNPIASSLYEQYGSAGLLLFKALVVGVIIAVLIRIPRRIMSRRVAVWVATAFVVVTAIAVLGNIHALSTLPAAPYHAVSTARLI